MLLITRVIVAVFESTNIFYRTNSTFTNPLGKITLEYMRNNENKCTGNKNFVVCIFLVYNRVYIEITVSEKPID